MAGIGNSAAAGGYRREVDGLRAIAVLVVMFYHAGFAGFGGGFVGVDIFFVISGYLITGIILRDRAAGTFRWGGFIERRVRRIFPALATVLLVTVPLAFVFMTPAALEGYASSLGATTVFAGNLYFWRMAGGYFGLTTGTMPLLHLWSLGLEEQFYLLYPPALLVLLRLRRGRWLVPGLAAMALASLLLCVMAATRAPAANFFLLPMRAWELLGGALVAATERHGGAWRLLRRSDAAGWIALAAAVAPVAFLNDETGFPWPWALPTVAGTAALLCVARADRGVGRWLACRPLVGIGLVSYSAYLWHQPLLAFARVILPRTPDAWGYAALLGASFGLAALSWRWIEQPWRSSALVPARRLWLVFAGVSASLLALALAAKLTGGLPQRFSAEERSLATMTARLGSAVEACMSPISDVAPPSPPCRVGGRGPVTHAVLGDSHAATLVPAVRDIMRRRGQQAVIYSHAGCPPVLDSGVLRPAQQPCGPYNRAALDAILADSNLTTVVLAARWTYYLQRRWFDNGEGGVELGPREAATTAGERATLVAAWRAMVDRLLAGGKRVVIVYPVPEPGWNVPGLMFQQARLGESTIDGSTALERVRARNAETYRALDSLGTSPRLHRLHPAAALCGSDRDGRCRAMAGTVPLFIDDDHLSPAGARHVLRDLPPAGR